MGGNIGIDHGRCGFSKTSVIGSAGDQASLPDIAATVSENVLWNFGAGAFGVPTDDGVGPAAGLIADRWGNLYGTTEQGGTCSVGGCGTVFELSPPRGTQQQWRERVLWSFGLTNGDGQTPAAALIADQSGNLYGTTANGGADSSCANGCGTVFEVSPPVSQQAQWRERVLWSFGASGDGSAPVASLIADKAGNLYGTTSGGGANSACADGGCGTVFELSPPASRQTQWREQVLWSFGGSGDGSAPAASLIADKAGNLYGTTSRGGANSACANIPIGNGCGTVFQLTPPPGRQTQWREQVLWSFGASGDGYTPRAGLIADGRGNLYGTTSGGGANDSCFFGFGCGTVFELSSSLGSSTQWREHIVWNFATTIDDGVQPVAGLLSDKWGNLYGTTEFGGTNACFFGCGTAFELSPPARQQSEWSEQVLWEFGADDDGDNPEANLIADPRRNLYGTTFYGGANGKNAGVGRFFVATALA